MASKQGSPSTRPYLIRALHEWCSDNGLTPYIRVKVNDSVQVPPEFVNNGEIILNVSLDATSALHLGDEYIEFKARFGGKARDIMVPVHCVMAIYARENSQGMAFPIEALPAEPAPPKAALVQLISSQPDSSSESFHSETAQGVKQDTQDQPDNEPDPPKPGGQRPKLVRVK